MTPLRWILGTLATWFVFYWLAAWRAAPPT